MKWDDGRQSAFPMKSCWEAQGRVSRVTGGGSTEEPRGGALGTARSCLCGKSWTQSTQSQTGVRCGAIKVDTQHLLFWSLHTGVQAEGMQILYLNNLVPQMLRHSQLFSALSLANDSFSQNFHTSLSLYRQLPPP